MGKKDETFNLQAIKDNAKNQKKEETKMKNQPKVETFKTIIITVLITGIIAFIGGITYESINQSKVHAEAKALVSQITVSKE